jgi:hypothetical protein
LRAERALPEELTGKEQKLKSKEQRAKAYGAASLLLDWREATAISARFARCSGS